MPILSTYPSRTLAKYAGVDAGGLVGLAVPPVRPFLVVTDFGADPTGIADSTSAIQAAINALPATGGEVWFPAPVANTTYKTTTAITIGNGAPPGTQASTRGGVKLRGLGSPVFPVTAGMMTNGNVKINYAGAGNTGVFELRGAMDGWGIEGLFIHANSLAQCCLYADSAAFGEMRNCTLFGGTVSQIFLTATSTSRNSQNNLFQNIRLRIPNVADSKGITLTGTTSNNSCFNRFDNILMNLTDGTGTTRTYGIYLGCDDSNLFSEITLNNKNVNSRAITFDYTNPQGNAFPNGDTFILCDFGGAIYENAGSPGSTQFPHMFISCTRTNGGTLPTLANTTVLDAWAERLAPRTFATLDANPGDGARSFITDSSVTTFNTNAAGGSNNHVPVFYSTGASAWKVG